jgi:hypothetical protein
LVAAEVRVPDIPRAEIDSHFTPAKDFTYFMDDTDVLATDDDEQQVPQRETALILSEAYFHALQGAFHFVRGESFLEMLATFLPHKSISKLDHIYAVETHLVYYARARRLGLDHRVVSDHPDVERVQAIAILAFYLLINGSIARQAYSPHNLTLTY